MKRTLFIFLYSVYQLSMAQPLSFTIPSIPSYEAREQNVFSLMVNPALSGGYHKPMIGVVSEMLYGMRELTQFSAVGVLPVRQGSFSGYLNYTGNDAFSISSLAGQYAQVLSSDDYAGCFFGYHMQQYAGYATLKKIYAGMGVTSKISSDWYAGMMLCAWHRTDVRKWEWPVYNLGIGYAWTPQFQVSAHVEKTIDEASSAYLQMRYLLRKKMELSVMGAPTHSIFGCRIVFHATSICLGFSVKLHPLLGATPGFMLMTAQN